LEISENTAGFANRHNFRMRRWIVCEGNAVRAFGEDAVFLDNQGSEGPSASGADIFQRQRNGAPHKVWGHGLSFYRASDCTAQSKSATRHFSDARNRLPPGP
jgi:hypothetical protein